MYNKKSKIELKKSLDRESFNRITCSFYKYCSIKSPEDFRNELYTNLENYNILGRIYVSYEGINAQISIPEHSLDEFKSYIRSFKIISGSSTLLYLFVRFIRPYLLETALK